MAQVKEEIIKLIESMPDECSISDVIVELYKQQMAEGLDDIDPGCFVSQEEIREQMAEWEKFTGQ